METLPLSVTERRRLAILTQVKANQITLAAAAEQLQVSYRHAKRLWSRFRVEGDAGLAHRSRGRPSARRIDVSVRERAVALYQEHYGDFGCTLACEYLASRHGLTVNRQTLSRWLKDAGLWRRRRRGRAKHQRRERRKRFGELVQLDGSHHDWFEGRGDPCVLMAMIDDATSRIDLRFFEGETLEASMTMMRRWSLRFGLPMQLYPDRHGIYRVNTKGADELETRTGKRPLTQFGRALAELGVKLTCARSPQAKGRVERSNGTTQDRLVKAMRVAGISDIASANEFLGAVYLAEHNARFAIAPVDTSDAHVKVKASQLDAALCVKETRVVGNDHCVSWQGTVVQLTPPRSMPSLAGKSVTVCVSLSGVVRVTWKDQRVPHRVPEQRPPSPVATTPATLSDRVKGHSPPYKPPKSHPWRNKSSAATVRS